MKKALIAIMLTAGAAHAADDDLKGFMLNAKGELCDEILDVEYMGKGYLSHQMRSDLIR